MSESTGGIISECPGDFIGIGTLGGRGSDTEPKCRVDRTLAEYADWMKGLMTIMPDGSYEVKSFATDTERSSLAQKQMRKTIGHATWMIQRLLANSMASLVLALHPL
jgi:hypothetical protein